VDLWGWAGRGSGGIGTVTLHFPSRFTHRR
jgi:hypothetical protein